MIHIGLKISKTSMGTEFKFDERFGSNTLHFWDNMVDYRSWSANTNVAFEMSLYEPAYIPKNLRELTKIRDAYVKKCGKVKRKLLRMSDVPWVDFI